MELIDIAGIGDYITIKSDPERIMTLDMTQKEANELLLERNIEQVREGVTDDEGLIVSQDPRTTLDIIKNKKVTTKAINPEDLILVELFNDDAPRSSWYFKRITELVEKPIGTLKVYFAPPGMKLAIFNGDNKKAKGLIPENSPEDNVPAGTIGLTNMSRKQVGLVGVRYEDNNEYGPTAEPFNGTNLLGKIITDLKILENLKDGQIVYIKEQKEN